MKQKIKKRNALVWVFERLEGDAGYWQRKFFGFEAAYLDGRLYLAVADGREPWAGLLVCTAKEQHAALRAEFSELRAHSVLGKWLYISQKHRDFERVAREMVELSLRRDARLGVESKSRKVLEGSKLGVVKRAAKKDKEWMG